MAKPGQKVSKEAKCPYYEKHDRVRIMCNCDLNGKYIASLWFPAGKKTMDPFMKQYCCNLPGYRKCDLYHED